MIRPVFLLTLALLVRNTPPCFGIFLICVARDALPFNGLVGLSSCAARFAMLEPAPCPTVLALMAEPVTFALMPFLSPRLIAAARSAVIAMRQWYHEPATLPR